MSRVQDDSAANHIGLDRRGFLAGVGATLGGLPLQALAAAAPAAGIAGAPRGQPRRAIHQDLAYIDHDGVGTEYDAPRGNQSTRDYVASLTQEEFLRRHWFT